jgi:hypothetical protein
MAIDALLQSRGSFVAGVDYMFILFFLKMDRALRKKLGADRWQFAALPTPSDCCRVDTLP